MDRFETTPTAEFMAITVETKTVILGLVYFLSVRHRKMQSPDFRIP